MKKETQCTECGRLFMKRQDKISKTNFCCASCVTKYSTGRPKGSGEWARLGRKEYMRQYLATYNKKNKIAVEAVKKEWAKNNKDKVRKISSAWQSRNKDKSLAGANRRRARKLKAIPAWSNKDAVDFMYANAKLIEAETGEKIHVDHIIPLQGKDVCGLHCEHNLRFVMAEDNLKKGIKYSQDDALFECMTHGMQTAAFKKSKKQVEAMYPVEIEIV